jgi:hypothetical protein
LLAAAALAPVAVASADTTLATGLPATVKVSLRGTAVAWSAPAPAGGFKLVIRKNGVIRDAAVAPSPRPFDVDLGDDGHGHLIASYSRCSGRLEAPTTRGCDVYVYAVTAARERRVAGLLRGAASDYLPTAAHGRIAFARSVHGRQPRLYVRALNGGSLRALPFGRRQVDSGPTSLDLGARGLAIAWKRTADYGSQQVRYDRLGGGSKVLATYGGGALAGTDVAGVSATRTGVFWGTEGYGESIGMSRLYLAAGLNKSSASRDPGTQLTSVSGASLRRAVVLSCEMRDSAATKCSVVLLGVQ